MNHIATLAMNLVAQPRVFAVLLGSGVSRDAGVPTGYEVTLDLIRRYAAAQEAQPEPDPESWFHDHVGRRARYGELLKDLAPTAAGRQALLKEYFEPTDEDRSAGRKLPTAAHQVIARMVRDGLISVVITTNFDRLTERALEEEGVIPVVISTTGALHGAPPLQHSACTVVKLHGDYLELNIRNTDEELAQYPKELNTYLDRILDEYGLIVAGWSAEWDVALRDAFDRRSGRRYQHYWLIRSERNDFQKKLIANNGAVVIEADSADTFFQELERAVVGARTRVFASPRTLEPPAAVAALKPLLAEDRHRIQLNDLLVGQTDALIDGMTASRFRTDTGAGAEEVTAESVAERMNLYEALAESCVNLVATGSFWARGDQHELFFEMIRRAANAPSERSGRTIWIQLQHYPALLLTYAAGIAFVGAKREELLLDLWSLPIQALNNDELAAYALNPWKVIDNDLAKQLPTMHRPTLIAPMSEYLLRVLRGAFSALIPAQVDYERVFDRFEYLSALIQADLTSREGGELSHLRRWFFVGRFSWQSRFELSPVIKAVESELETQGPSWPLLAAGLFGGDLDKLRSAKEEIDQAAHRMAF